MTRWNVYLNGKKIDEVSYNDDCNKDYVLDGLIDHDGYDPNINIRKRRR